MQEKIDPNNLTGVDYQYYRTKCQGNINTLLMYLHHVDDGYRFQFLSKLFNWNNSKETLDVEFCKLILKNAEDLEELVLCLPYKVRQRFIDRISIGYEEMLSKHDAERLTSAPNNKQVARQSHQQAPQTINPVLPETLPLHSQRTNGNIPTNKYLTLEQLNAVTYKPYIEYRYADEMISPIGAYYRPAKNEQCYLRDSLDRLYNARSEYGSEKLHCQPTATTPAFKMPEFQKAWNTPYNSAPPPQQNLSDSQSTDASLPQMLVRSSELGFFAQSGLVDSGSTLLRDFNAREQTANHAGELTDSAEQFVTLN